MKQFKMKYVNEELLARVSLEVKRERIKIKEDRQWVEHCKCPQQKIANKEDAGDNKELSDEKALSKSHGPSADLDAAPVNPETCERLRNLFRSKLLAKLASIPEISIKEYQPETHEKKDQQLTEPVKSSYNIMSDSRTTDIVGFGTLICSETKTRSTENPVTESNKTEKIDQCCDLNRVDSDVQKKDSQTEIIVHFETTDSSSSSLEFVKKKNLGSFHTKLDKVIINKSTERIVPEQISNLEATEFVNKIKLFRKNIKSVLDKIMTRIDECPIFDEQKQWEQMKNRMKEFEIRFSRNHVYQLRRLFEETRSGLTSSRDSSQQIRLKMKQILSLYQKIYQAIQSFCRSMNMIWMGRYNKVWLTTLNGQADSSKTVLMSLLNMIADFDITCDMHIFPDEIQSVINEACSDDGLVAKSKILIDYIESTPKLIKRNNTIGTNMNTKKTSMLKSLKQNHYNAGGDKCLKSAYEAKLSRTSPINAKQFPISKESIMHGNGTHFSLNPLNLENESNIIPSENDLISEFQVPVPVTKDSPGIGKRNAIYTVTHIASSSRRDSEILPIQSPIDLIQKDDKIPVKLQRSTTPNSLQLANTHRNDQYDISSQSNTDDYNLSFIYETMMAAAEMGDLSEPCQQLLPVIAKALRNCQLQKSQNARPSTARSRLIGDGSLRSFIDCGGTAVAGKAGTTSKDGRLDAADASGAASERLSSKKSACNVKTTRHKITKSSLEPSNQPKETPRLYTPVKGQLKRFSVNHDLVNNILDARTEHIKNIATNNLYKISRQRRPWDMVSRVSDRILDEIIIDVSKEMLAVQESLVRGLFAAELT